MTIWKEEKRKIRCFSSELLPNRGDPRMSDRDGEEL